MYYQIQPDQTLHTSVPYSDIYLSFIKLGLAAT